MSTLVGRVAVLFKAWKSISVSYVFDNILRGIDINLVIEKHNNLLSFHICPASDIAQTLPFLSSFK